MRGSPGFCGELGKYCSVLHDHTLPKYGSRLYLQAVSYTLGKVRMPGMVLKDEQLTAYVVQHVFVWLHSVKSNFLGGLTICIEPRVPFGTIEAVYHLYYCCPHADLETTAPHDAYFTECLSVLP